MLLDFGQGQANCYDLVAHSWEEGWYVLAGISWLAVALRSCREGDVVLPLVQSAKKIDL